MQRLNFIWHLSRFKKRVISVSIDTLLIVLALHVALWTRLGDFQFLIDGDNLLLIGLTVITTVAIFTKTGLYRAVLRYLTFQALFVVTAGALLSAISLAVFAYYLQEPIPRTVPIIYCAYLALLCGGSRLVVRNLVATTSPLKDSREEVLIYGAGSGGRQLAVALRASDHYRVRAFIDEDKTLTNTMILGLPVIDLGKAEGLIEKHDVSKILLAIPSASRARRKQVLDLLAPLPVEIQTVPEMADIVSGKAKIDELTDVPIEDLLGRDAVTPQQSLMEANIKDKVVMVTGAGGSIGSELCRQILKQQPKTLVLF